MASSQEQYNIRLKTSLFEAKLSYNDFKRLLIMNAKKSGGMKNKCMVLRKKPRVTGKQFSK